MFKSVSPPPAMSMAKALTPPVPFPFSVPISLTAYRTRCDGWRASQLAFTAGITFSGVIRPVTEKNAQAPSLANAASFDGAQVARGSIAAAFGTSLARGTAQAASANLPFELGGVTVTVGGFAARLIFVAPGQINFVMPQGIADGDMIDFSVNTQGQTPEAGALVLILIAIVMVPMLYYLRATRRAAEGRA